MPRWTLALSLLTACAQAHWECVDAGGEVLEAGDVTCDDFVADGAKAWEEAAQDCAADACTCRFVTNECETPEE